MPITYQQSLDEIAQLVKQFNTNRAAYLAPGFKEAQARQALIDPLFIALGWDVHNSEHAAPDYQFVLVEEPNPAHGHQRSPDYTFRTGKHDRKFFAEAKKPGIALKSSADAGYQLRSYGWNAKLPVSILTDFDEFAVYNCRRKPQPHQPLRPCRQDAPRPQRRSLRPDAGAAQAPARRGVGLRARGAPAADRRDRPADRCAGL